MKVKTSEKSNVLVGPSNNISGTPSLSDSQDFPSTELDDTYSVDDVPR